ncbi:hypothetical protein BT96DRAFT_589066 [Gymnopus androsaceus JB14]|uniref:Spc7 kinetochore protein domain-containing protein n=1 Tax=Gymnopus androsaceus JB14 TaxID=1447944 RepID=A0A6A4II15_9AGAR|nr:hypothetical protein BT96DRAFT_589066 [Gymnopus androsaceus JB14]
MRGLDSTSQVLYSSGMIRGKERQRTVRMKSSRLWRKKARCPATSQPINAQPQQMEMEAGTSTPKTPVVDLSALLEQTVFGDEEETESREGPTGMDTAATEQWRDAIPEDGYAVEESPPISIEQFFEMTGIGFVELTAPRRSLHPSQISSQKPRNPTEASLAECANVMAIELPQLVLYSRVCQDIEERIQKSKADFEQMEDEAAKMTPELFLEYSGADQESQKELVQCLNLIRKNTRLRARSDWYDWKLEWIEDLKHTAENAFTNLQNDARSLEKIKAKADEIVPQLQQEYDEIMRELEAEKVEVAQIEECDQDYLNELKNTIAEQNVEVESLRAEVKEADDQLHWLEERLENIAEQKREATAGIAEANRALHLQTNSTGAEVFRLKNELKALEDLHMFHVSKVQSDTFEYIYASEYHVIIPCRDYYPVTKEIDILRLPEMRTKSKDSFPRLTSFLLSAAKEHVRRSKASTVRHIVQVLADFWSSGKQLRNQILQLSFKYPVEIEARQTPEKPFSEFAARTMILFPAKKAKAYVSFVFDSDTFSRWPLSVNSLRWEVQIGYGSINEQSVVEAISERMSEVSPSHTYACMIDACIEVQEACG